MRVICVILCLIISTTAYAESILWGTKHSSTSLEKDQKWISEQLFSEQSVTGSEVKEDIASDIEDPEADSEKDCEEFIEFIDPMIMVEGTEATPLGITMDSSSLDEMQEYAAPEEGVA